MDNTSSDSPPVFPLGKILKAGWLCLLLSGILLAVSIYVSKFLEGDNITIYVLWLTFARIFGIGSFVIGVIGIAAGKWNQGTLLPAGSVVLPVVSLYIHQTL